MSKSQCRGNPRPPNAAVSPDRAGPSKLMTAHHVVSVEIVSPMKVTVSNYNPVDVYLARNVSLTSMQSEGDHNLFVAVMRRLRRISSSHPGVFQMEALHLTNKSLRRKCN